MSEPQKPDERLNTVDEVIASMERRFHPENCKNLKAAYHWTLTGDGGREFTILVDHGTFAIEQGPHEGADVQMEMDVNEYLRLVNGDLKGVVAIMTRKLKVKGNLSLTAKLDTIFI